MGLKKCGIGTGKSHSPGEAQLPAFSVAQDSGTAEMNSTLVPATAAARPKKLRRDTDTLGVGEEGLVFTIVLLWEAYSARRVRGGQGGREMTRAHFATVGGPAFERPSVLLHSGSGRASRTGAVYLHSKACVNERILIFHNRNVPVLSTIKMTYVEQSGVAQVHPRSLLLVSLIRRNAITAAQCSDSLSCSAIPAPRKMTVAVQ